MLKFLFELKGERNLGSERANVWEYCFKLPFSHERFMVWNSSDKNDLYKTKLSTLHTAWASDVQNDTPGLIKHDGRMDPIPYSDSWFLNGVELVKHCLAD